MPNLNTTLIVLFILLLVAIIIICLATIPQRSRPCCNANLDADEPHEPHCAFSDVTPRDVLDKGCLWGVINPAGTVVATRASRDLARIALEQHAEITGVPADRYAIDLVCPLHPDALHGECDSDTDADLPALIAAEDYAESLGLDPHLRRTCGTCNTWLTGEHALTPSHLHATIAAVHRGIGQ